MPKAFFHNLEHIRGEADLHMKFFTDVSLDREASTKFRNHPHPDSRSGLRIQTVASPGFVARRDKARN